MGTPIPFDLKTDEELIDNRKQRIDFSHECIKNTRNKIYRIRHEADHDNFKAFIKVIDNFNDIENNLIPFQYIGYLDKSYIINTNEINIVTRDQEGYYLTFIIDYFHSEDDNSRKFLKEFLYSDRNKSDRKPLTQVNYIKWQISKFPIIDCTEFEKYQIMYENNENILYLNELKFDKNWQPKEETKHIGIIKYLFIKNNFINFIVDTNGLLHNIQINIMNYYEKRDQLFALELNTYFEKEYGKIV